MAADVSIVLDSAPQFFRRRLLRAKLTRHCETSDVVDEYLVSLLVEHVLPGRLLSVVYDHSVVLLLAEALTSHGAERLERLQTLGDAVLFTSGFFEEWVERTGIERRYLYGLGARAYAEAGRTLDPLHGPVDTSRVPDLFAELADAFPELVDVLRELAFSLEGNASPGEAGTLALYERWLATGSTALAQALMRRGLVPTRGTKSPH